MKSNKNEMNELLYICVYLYTQKLTEKMSFYIKKKASR